MLLAPLSPVLADTQARLVKLATEIEEMKDHRTHLDSRLDTIEKGQNDLTKTVQEMAALVKALLKSNREQKEAEEADYNTKIQELRIEFNAGMEKNVADIHAGAVEMLQNRCDYHKEDASMSEVSRLRSHDSHDQNSDATDSYASPISVTHIPYSNMAQFGVTHAEESTQLSADGHHRQKRPIDDVVISGSG